MSDLTDTRVFVESTQTSDGAAAVPPGAKPGHTKLYPGPGFRMRRNHHRPPREVVAGLGAFETPEVSDLLNKALSLRP